MFVESSGSGGGMRGLWADDGGSDPNDVLLSGGGVGGEREGHAELVYQLIHAVENAHHSPVLLPYPQALVDRITGLIVEQTRAVEQLLQAEQQEQEQAQLLGETSFMPFKRSEVLKYELQRVQFLLCELLRTRLRLIEKLCFLIAHEDSAPAGASRVSSQRLVDLLSHNEHAIAIRLAKIKHACMMSSGLRNVPEPLQHLVPNLPHGEGMEILPVVEAGKHVFVYFLQDIEGTVELAPEVSETMTRGEIFLVPFSSLGQFVVDGRARLI